MKHFVRSLLLCCLLLPAFAFGETWLLEDLDLGPCHVRVEADPLSDELIEVRVTQITDAISDLPLGFTLYCGADAVGALFGEDGAWIGYAECQTDTLTIVPFYDGYEDPAGTGIISGTMHGTTDVSRWEVYCQRGTYMIEGSARYESGVCHVLLYSGCSIMEANPIVSWDVYVNGDFISRGETQTLDDKGRWTDRRLLQLSVESPKPTSIRIVPVMANGTVQLRMGADFYCID